MSLYFYITLSIIIGYLFGSIPFALVIGKLFYKVDVRNYGSGNLGSTNVTRTLGVKAGVSVLILDLLKSGVPSLLMYIITYNFLKDSSYASQLPYAPITYFVTSFMASIGHSHPLFANFKGGKCVASICGTLIFFNYRLALVGILTYVIILIITKVVSLASISAALITMIFVFIPWFQDSYLFDISNPLTKYIYYLCMIFLGLLLIYRHIPNIKRLKNHEEKKFSFDKINKK